MNESGGGCAELRLAAMCTTGGHARVAQYQPLPSFPLSPRESTTSLFKFKFTTDLRIGVKSLSLREECDACKLIYIFIGMCKPHYANRIHSVILVRDKTDK